MTHITTAYKAEQNYRTAKVMPLFHFRCNCGLTDTTGYAPFRLEVARQAHEATK